MKGPQDRQHLEQELLGQVNTAAQTYRSAKAQTKIILEQYADLPLGHSDGNLARRQAAANEAMALERYRQALHAFTDLIIHGRQPPES